MHYYTDKYGYDCAVEMIFKDGTVVFDSVPKLSFDYKMHGISIRRLKCSVCYDYGIPHNDYVLSYEMKNGHLYFRSFLARLPFFHKSVELFGVKPEKHGDGELSIYKFDDIPAKYSGTLIIGRDFDHRYWPTDDRSSPIPFCPEVFKKNGYIKFEQGKVIDYFLESRTNDE